MDTSVAPQRFSTVKRMVELPAYNSWLTEPAVRHLIFNAEPRINSRGDEIGGNGLDTAIVRIGRKVLIDLDEFDAWVRAHARSSDPGSEEIVGG